MKEELSFQLRETLFLLSTNMADVTAAENQQFPAIVTLFDLKLKSMRRAGISHYNPICVAVICILS